MKIVQFLLYYIEYINGIFKNLILIVLFLKNYKSLKGLSNFKF